MGRGTLKIIKACKDAQLPEPQIFEKNGGVQITIFKKNDIDSLPQIRSSITDRQNEILNLIKHNNTISKRKIAEQLQINVSAVQRHLDLLKNKGLLLRKGGTRGYWVVKDV